ncbi:MAG: extracellular solute-binding protein, partial [Planctomycetes bacterium]|nr:extracellular solute-binding protein [Planctomycetota bacterium]
MRSLKIVLVVGFLVCSAVLLQAARGADEAVEGKDDGTVTLRITVRDPNVTAVYQRARRNVFEAFVRTHPRIKVDAVNLLAMEGMGNQSRLLAIAGGIEPEVTSLYYQQMHSEIEQGFLAPMDDYLDTWKMYDEVPKQLWPVVTGNDGRRYGAIYTWPTLYLVYRKDLFEEVGLDPNHPPKNWDELFEYAKLLSDPDRIVPTAIDKRSQFGRMGMFLAVSGSWKFSNFVWQAGGDIVKEFAQDPHTGELIPLPEPDAPPEDWIAKKGTPDEFDMRKAEHKWKAVFDSPAGVQALEFYRKMRWTKWERNGKEYTGVIRTGFGSSAGVNYQSAFSRGEVAMALMPLRVLQDVLEQNIVRLEAIGVAPLPAGPTGIRASIVDGDCWVMSGSIKNDKRKMDAAWEYIKFMTGKESRKIETQTYVESGYARFIRNPYWLKEFGYDEYFAEIDPQLLAAFDDALKYGRPEPYCPGYASMSVDMNEPLSKVLRTPDADPAEELKTVVKRINTFFFKLYPEEEMRFKRRVFLVLAVIVAAGLSFAIYMIVKSLQARIAASKSGLSVTLKSSRWKHVYAWLFLLPALGTILLWSYTPLAAGSGMSFYDYKIMGNSTFIGLDNFIEAAGQPVFWKALKNTVYY